MQKGAIDLDIARQTKDEKIAQEQIKTANDMETLKQSQITSYFMSKKYQADINHSNASASNLWANARATNFNTNVAKSRFNEEETIKSLYSNVNEYSQNSGKQGEDAFDGYYNGLYLKYLDAKQQGFDTSAYEREISLLNKHKPSIMQMYKVQFDGANPYVKNSGNGANSMSDYSNVLTQIGQANVMKEQLVKDINATNKEIDDLQRKGVNTEELKTKKTQLEQKLSQLQGVPNTANAKSLMNYFTDSLGKTAGEKTYNQMINYSQIKQDIRLVADAIDTVALYGWSGEGLNKLAHMFGVATNKDDINNKIIALLNNIQGDTGAKLKQQYENIVRLTPNTSAFGMNVKRMQQDLTNLNEHINININSILYPHKENAEVIKKSFNVSTKPLEFKYDYEDYRKTNATPNNTLEMYRKMPYA